MRHGCVFVPLSRAGCWWGPCVAWLFVVCCGLPACGSPFMCICVVFVGWLAAVEGLRMLSNPANMIEAKGSGAHDRHRKAHQKKVVDSMHNACLSHCCRLDSYMFTTLPCHGCPCMQHCLTQPLSRAWVRLGHLTAKTTSYIPTVTWCTFLHKCLNAQLLAAVAAVGCTLGCFC